MADPLIGMGCLGAWFNTRHDVVDMRGSLTGCFRTQRMFTIGMVNKVLEFPKFLRA